MTHFNYKVQLVPIDSFYFGSTEHFGEKNSNTYILKSERWPQQTSVIGMLRKELLIQNNLIRVRYNEEEKMAIQQLIGKEGFVFKDEMEKTDFGAIKAISPIMLADKGQEVYTQCPRDCRTNVNKEYISFEIKRNMIRTFNIEEGKEREVPYFTISNEEFNPKVGYSNDLVDIKKLQIKKASECIKEAEQVGIHREQEEKALYKLTSYKIDRESDLRFVFYMDLDETKISHELHSNIVQLGSKNSLFYMEVEKLDNLLSDKEVFESEEWQKHAAKIEEVSGFRPIWVLSDTYLSQKELNQVEYAVSETKNFRYIYNRSGEYSFKKSKATYQFIARGSVLYCKNSEEVKELINGYSFLKQIGYNYVI